MYSISPARELHDSVTQSLSSLTLFTEAARHMAEEEGNESNRMAITKLLNFDIEREMASAAPANKPLEAVRTIAARAWPSVTVDVPQDIGNIAETLSKQHEELEK